MKAISEDLRERAVAAVVSEGWSRARAGQVYGLSAVSVGRYVRAYQAGESLTPRQGGGRPRKLRLPEHVEALREHLQAAPDLELSARCEHLARTKGIQVSVPTLWRAVRALGWTRKKRPSPPASRTRWSALPGAGRRPWRWSQRAWSSWTRAEPTVPCARATATRPREHAATEKSRATAGATLRSWQR